MLLVIEGTSVYLTEYGSGSPILFLHGAPDSAEMWSGVIEHLKDQHRCFAPDLPGFGRSAAPANFTCSLENMACFLDQFIEEAAIPTPLPRRRRLWGHVWPILGRDLSAKGR